MRYRIIVEEPDGSKPDLGKIARDEEWARGLMSFDMDGFAMDQDGGLLLLDECGKHAYVPEGRFRWRVVPNCAAKERG